MKKYDVVIVNYNGEKIISDCLNSLSLCSVLPSKIIIYDNNSTDNSVEIIKKNFPHAILIEGSDNIGFGRANNRAMKHSDAEFILFMNNDLIVDKDCPEKLLEGFREENITILNPVIFKGWDKKKDQELYAFGATVNNTGFGYGLYDTDGDRLDMSCFSGACVMVRSTIIKRLKFEKNFFLYYEEPELSVRILKEDLKIGRILDAKCYHLESYSSPQKLADGVSFRQFYGVQNRWFMIGKHWPLRLLPTTILVNYLHLFYLMYFFVRNRKFSYLKLFYLAPVNLIKGYKSREHNKAKNKFWYKRLDKLSLTKYLVLSKKVFTKS